MSLGLVVGPACAELAGSEAVEGADRVHVRAVGETPAACARSLRDMFADGVETLLVVDRAVPIHADWADSEAPLALVADHLNLTGDNPLVGSNADEWGPRFPDLTDAWDPALRRALRERAASAGIELSEGVLAGVSGTALTAAELDMLRTIGADMASDGFVHEAIVARHAGRRVAGIALLAARTEPSGEAVAVAGLVREALSALSVAGRGAPGTAG